MQDSQPAVGFDGESEKPFPWGCLLGGCLTVAVLFIGGIAVTGLAGYWLYKGQLDKYTSAEAREIPTVDLTPEEIDIVEQRVESFRADIKAGESPEELILTADDINALISRNKDLKGRVFVKIGDGEITADVSVPTDAIPGGKGRFFNGSVTADAELRDGVLIVTVSEAEVNGSNVPEDIMVGIRRENLAKDLYKDPEAAKTMAKFESLKIEDDRIILSPKRDANEKNSENPSGDTPAAEQPAAEQPVAPTSDNETSVEPSSGNQ